MLGAWSIALLAAQVATSSAGSAGSAGERVASRLLVLLEARALTRAEVKKQAATLSRPELEVALAEWKRIGPPDERGFLVYEDLRGYGTGSVPREPPSVIHQYRPTIAPEPEVGLSIGELFAGAGVLLLWRVVGLLALYVSDPSDGAALVAIGAVDGVVSSAIAGAVVWGIASTSHQYEPSYLHAFGGAAGVYVAGLAMAVGVAATSGDLGEGKSFGIAAAGAGIILQPLGATIAVNAGKLPHPRAVDPFAADRRPAIKVPLLALAW